MPVKSTGRARTALVLLALLVPTLAACATTTTDRSQRVQHAQQRFADADLDHDGYLNQEETRRGTPRLAPHFDEIDSDHDGRLSTVEIMAYLKQRRGSR